MQLTSGLLQPHKTRLLLLTWTAFLSALFHGPTCVECFSCSMHEISVVTVTRTETSRNWVPNMVYHVSYAGHRRTGTQKWSGRLFRSVRDKVVSDILVNVQRYSFNSESSGSIEEIPLNFLALSSSGFSFAQSDFPSVEDSTKWSERCLHVCCSLSQTTHILLKESNSILCMDEAGHRQHFSHHQLYFLAIRPM